MNERFVVLHSKQLGVDNGITFEYIRGLIEGEGCFTFCPTSKTADGSYRRVPEFIIGMHERDRQLLIMVRDKMGLNSRIYARKAWRGDGINRGNTAILMVRDFRQLKDVIIPFFYKRLRGHKGKQFMDWLEKIGSKPGIPDKYKSLYRLYKLGVYDKNPKFTQKFID